MAQCDVCGQDGTTFYAQPIPGERFACLLCEACFGEYQMAKADFEGRVLGTLTRLLGPPAGSERPGEGV